MKERQEHSEEDKNGAHKKAPESNEDDSVKEGKKAIDIRKKINDIPDAVEKQDAEQWRNEG